MFAGYIALLIIFGFILIKSTDHLVGEIRNLARVTKLDKFGLTAFLLAFATSLPELVVGIASAIEGRPTLSLGNVLGSNIADISFVMGGVAFVGGSVKVIGKFLTKDLFSAFLAGSLPLLLLIDGNLSRIDAVVLLAVYLWFTYTVLGQKNEELAEYQGEKSDLFHRIFLRLKHDQAKKHYLWMGFWALCLMLSADMLVRVSSSFAGALSLPVILVGIFFVAIGTSLPELAFEIRAIKSNESAMVFGDLLGSVVANSTLVLGLTALIRPIVLDGGFQPYLLATVAFVLIFALFWLFVSTKKKLERWEGVLLFVIYCLFIYLEFSRVNGSGFGNMFKRLFLP